MRIVFLTTDLMFSSRVSLAAQNSNCQLDVVSRPGDAIDKAAAGEIALLLLDLRCPDLNVAQLVSSIRSDSKQPVAIVAFAPHVQESKLDAARQAGCDRVLSKGQFNQQIDQLLAEFAPSD